MTMIELGKITEIRTGRLNANQAIEGGKYPFFTCSVNPLRIDDYAYDCECVLVAGNGDLNVKYYNGKFNAYQRVYIVESIDKSKYDVKFLYYFLQTHIDTLRRNSIGGVIKYIRLGDLTNAEVPNFTIETQRKIVSVIEKSEKALVLRKQQIEALSALKQSVFLDMFGDPIENDKNWEIKKLKDVGILARGKSKHRPRNAPELLGGPYPLIQTGDIPKNNLYIESYNQTYSELGLLQSKIWPKGTLCITIAANIAHTGILTFDACFPDSVVGFKSQSISNIFVSLWFSFLQKNIEKNAPQSAQKNINLKILNDLDIISPPKALQEEFEKRILKIERNIKELEQSLKMMLELYDSLLYKAFNGELFKEEIKA